MNGRWDCREVHSPDPGGQRVGVLLEGRTSRAAWKENRKDAHRCRQWPDCQMINKRTEQRHAKHRQLFSRRGETSHLSCPYKAEMCRHEFPKLMSGSNTVICRKIDFAAFLSYKPTGIINRIEHPSDRCVFMSSLLITLSKLSRMDGTSCAGSFQSRKRDSQRMSALAYSHLKLWQILHLPFLSSADAWPIETTPRAGFQ